MEHGKALALLKQKKMSEDHMRDSKAQLAKRIKLWRQLLQVPKDG
jgi:hypothetical protein